MTRKLIATIALVAALWAAAALSAAPAVGAPDSPGACNMFHVANSAVGFEGMLNSGNGQGLENMMALVEASGCL